MTMAAAARRPKLGDQRWLACYTNTAALEALAKKRGWNPEGHGGPLDYADYAEVETFTEVPSFDAAVKLATSWQAKDFFGCPRVYLQEFGPADIEPLAREWEDVKFWDVEADGTVIEQGV
jgi:hypothetical protein